MTHELGYARDDLTGAGSGTSRHGHSTKTISTANGPVAISAPRDRNGEFEPKIVPKRARRVGQIEEMILSLYARGRTTREIEAQLREVYGIDASRELISTVTDVVADEIELWRNRPVDELYPIVYVDGIRLKDPGQGRGDGQGRAPAPRCRRRGTHARPGLLDHRGPGREVLAVGVDPAARSRAA